MADRKKGLRKRLNVQERDGINSPKQSDVTQLPPFILPAERQGAKKAYCCCCKHILRKILCQAHSFEQHTLYFRGESKCMQEY